MLNAQAEKVERNSCMLRDLLMRVKQLESWSSELIEGSRAASTLSEIPFTYVIACSCDGHAESIVTSFIEKRTRKTGVLRKERERPLKLISQVE
jgi:hypothetical protein